MVRAVVASGAQRTDAPRATGIDGDAAGSMLAGPLVWGMVPPWRGASYHIRIEQRAQPETGSVAICLDDRNIGERLIPQPGDPGERHVVQVRSRRF